MAAKSNKASAKKDEKPKSAPEAPKEEKKKEPSKAEKKYGKEPPAGPVEIRGKRFETQRVELERCYLHAKEFHHDGPLGKLWKGDVYNVPVRDAKRLMKDWEKENKFEVVDEDKAKKIRAAKDAENWKKLHCGEIDRKEKVKTAVDRKIKAIMSTKNTKF